MSRENVEAMRRAMQAVNGRNLDGFLALMGDDVEAVPLMSGIEGSYRGHDGMRRWWAAILDSFPDFAPEVLGARDHEDVVVATLRVTGRGATGDTPFESTLWHVSLWRRGKCSWWGVYDNERQALEAVGLSE